MQNFSGATGKNDSFRTVLPVCRGADQIPLHYSHTVPEIGAAEGGISFTIPIGNLSIEHEIVVECVEILCVE